MEKAIQCKPFLKWAGGKGQLIEEIATHLPDSISDIDTYVEPFIGSGAVMFWLVNRYQNIKKVVINDLNTDLTNLYFSIKFDVDGLIGVLKELDAKYRSIHTQEERSVLYYQIRNEYNSRPLDYKDINNRISALFIFLNRTCFNGLYRVNRKNLFNVPFGKYNNPRIVDEENLRKVNELLQKVEILNGDYAETIKYANNKAFFYLDPPYKPITETSSFNSYSSTSFDDEQQKRLKDFCDYINKNNGLFMLSNSDPKSVDETNDFFDKLYGDYNIHRVLAKRNINSKGDRRGTINELLITNY